MEGGNKKRATRELATISLIACIIVEIIGRSESGPESALLMTVVFVGVKRRRIELKAYSFDRTRTPWRGPWVWRVGGSQKRARDRG